jgi:hypothetical protein
LDELQKEENVINVEIEHQPDLAEMDAGCGTPWGLEHGDRKSDGQPDQGPFHHTNFGGVCTAFLVSRAKSSPDGLRKLHQCAQRLHASFCDTIFGALSFSSALEQTNSFNPSFVDPECLDFPFFDAIFRPT